MNHQTTERVFKSCIRHIDHRNKTSIFDVTQEETRDNVAGATGGVHRSPHRTMRKRVIGSPPLETKIIFHSGHHNEINRKYGKRINPDPSSLNLFSKDRNDRSEKKSSKKMSSYTLQNNPCKWGVDVLRYALPPPRRLYRHVDNLSTCLVPNQSEDSVIPKKKEIHYVTQLEKSLCPKESVFVPNLGKKFIYLQEPQLEMNCIPRDCEKSRVNTKSSSRRGNLNTNLIPIEETNRKAYHISTDCRNKQCSVEFNCDKEPLPYRSGKRTGYLCGKSEHSIFLF
ncbi:conserved Plasmodium protein, unknown function [Plasmodium ovale wallikeri]|uniref:Uncharacterized protein n=1 Tax=Plasmodium ovale wallikeri TaxID=864142 RepID=A0A1A8YIK6_PLAOA|nr:conserved Plasmodium protein, unknown function [Plasmodium ovale wallikeri]SBT31975.1 conserved Plasmodium protein, unknown function [Plasmodium ovale wallikeri]